MGMLVVLHNAKSEIRPVATEMMAPVARVSIIFLAIWGGRRCDEHEANDGYNISYSLLRLSMRIISRATPAPIGFNS